MLGQVDIDLSGYTPDSLAGLTIEGNPLKDWSAISTVWEDQPPTTDRLHLVVTFKSTSGGQKLQLPVMSTANKFADSQTIASQHCPC